MITVQYGAEVLFIDTPSPYQSVMCAFCGVSTRR